MGEIELEYLPLSPVGDICMRELCPRKAYPNRACLELPGGMNEKGLLVNRNDVSDH